MKIKFLSVAVSLIIVLSAGFAGCSKGETSSQPDSASSSQPDASFTDSASSAFEDTGSDNREESVPASSGEDGDYVFDYTDPGEGIINMDFSFDYMTAEDDGLLDGNPDRGYRTEMVLYIEERRDSTDDPRTAYVTDSKAKIRESLEFVFNIYFKKGVNPNDKLFLAYIYITDFRDDPISKAAPVLNEFFRMCRERKVKSMLRFCYNNNYAKNFTLSQENKDLLASQCADEETILRHIDELAPYISEYADTIHTISSGFIGYVGEWAYHYQYPEVSYPKVMKAIVEKLCVPNGLFFSTRHPEYKSRVGDSYKYLNYISYNNDAMYGEQTNHNWNSGNYQIGTDGWWEKVTRVAAYTPQDGEMYTNDVLFRYNMLPKGWDIIKECARHRHTSMSNWHGYIEALNRDNIIQRWIDNETVTPAALNSQKILYDPYWFKDNRGNTVKRNPYEFLRDHLGYRLSLCSGHIEGENAHGATVDIEITLRNYGFAAPFMLRSGFALLDENYNLISEFEAGAPETWYSHAPDNSATNLPLDHKVGTRLRLPNKNGKYFIAFYLKNSMGEYARLANKMSFKGGYNLLYSVTLK